MVDDHAQPSDTDSAESTDELKDRFKAALDRKRGIQAEAHGAGGPEGGKIHGAQGKAGAKRQFRRKSGG